MRKPPKNLKDFLPGRSAAALREELKAGKQ
jgi:hypothetical protein